jgi:S1-C subfamily serine protease
VQGPEHYDSAKKHKSDALGMTVKNLTYEVRRYFRRPPEEPGVIVSKVEPGGKASVSGIRPYEIVTHINDKPAMDVGDFEELLSKPGELLLSVKRMHKGRVVKIQNGGVSPRPQDSKRGRAGKNRKP